MSKHNNARQLNDQGLALIQQANFSEAARILKKAADLHPQLAEIWNNYGAVLNNLKRHEEAVQAHQRAISIDPAYSEAYNNLGVAFAALGQAGAAFDAFDRAVSIDETYDKARRNRAAVFSTINDKVNSVTDDEVIVRRLFEYAVHNFQSMCYVESLPYLAALLQLRPNDHRARKLMASNLVAVRRFREAIEALNELASLDPSDAEIQRMLSRLYDREGNLEKAYEAFKRAISIDKNLPTAISGPISYAFRIGDWSDVPGIVERAMVSVERDEGNVYPFSLFPIVTTPSQQLQCAQAFVRAQTSSIKPLPKVLPSPIAMRKIRIGYASGDFRQHPVGQLMSGVIEAHDRQRFDIFGFCWSTEDGSEVRARLREAFVGFSDITNIVDEDVARVMREAKIDILVDLKGFTNDVRTAIFAYKPAPVQVNFLGFPGTMGAEFMDYIIGDPVVIPEGSEVFFQEQVVRLPHCYLPNEQRRHSLETALDRETCGLPPEGFVFCNFAQTMKLNPSLFGWWMQVLLQVPGSVLWLREPQTQTAKATLIHEAEAHGVNSARLIFAPRVQSHAEHFARQRLADLILDTYPYTSHTTASEALWDETPILTLQGETFVSRVCASILTELGVDDLIARTPEAYVRKAVGFAQDPASLQAVREAIAQRRQGNVLYDPVRYTRSLEQAFLTMAERSAAGLPPAAFNV
ncbi:MAG: tetratricopeptide repeat protein [Hyphomicrobiales bacterium]|nr:tetratricopeptide repeat protein [Hyphomicrobiales bacterium]